VLRLLSLGLRVRHQALQVLPYLDKQRRRHFGTSILKKIKTIQVCTEVDLSPYNSAKYSERNFIVIFREARFI
jgi:hypothetical protein